MANHVDALMQRHIPEQDEAFLRSCNGDIPDWLRRAYWHYKSIHDRVSNGRLLDTELKQIVFTARMVSGQPPHDNPAKPFDIRPLIGGDVVFGTYIRVWWRNAEWKGQFIEQKKNKGVVIVLIEAGEREIPYGNVLGLWEEAKQPVEA